MKIAVLMGGNSSELDISLVTGKAVNRALNELGHNVLACPFENDISDVIHVLKEADLVFIALHGGEGEDGTIQQLLEDESICYTGSGPDSSTLSMDKHLAKSFARKKDILTPSWLHLNLDEDEFVDLSESKFSYPVVVKPNGSGSTMGLTIVKESRELDEAISLASQFDSRLLVEEYITGRELTVGILNEESLPIVEIKPSHDMYDYECKYTEGMSDYTCPAELFDKLTEEIQKVSVKIYKLMGCRHYARVDFLLDSDDNYYFLEVNTLPGLTGTSLVPKAAKAVDMSFNDLIAKIVELAVND
jgi:D-alanine-D-alanine ligase